MGSKSVKTAQVVEFQLHVRYEVGENLPISNLLETISRMIEEARGDGEVTLAVLTGLPQSLSLK